MEIKNEILEICRKSKKASYLQLSIEERDRCLAMIAEKIEQKREEIKKENSKDIRNAEEKGVKHSLLKRLKIDDQIIDGMIESLKQISALEDPLNKILEERKIEGGVNLKKVTTPIGVILIIYESRPNVTVEAAALCIKSGNSVILRGGSDAINSNLVLAKIIEEVISDKVQLVKNTDREIVNCLLKMDRYIDLVIPRGGEGLINFVKENSTIPVLKHDKGLCHIYIDKSADFEKAVNICINSKVQNPGVCNAVETILINKEWDKENIKRIIDELKKNNVEVRGCEKIREIADVKEADAKDWDTEYLDYIISVKIVSSAEDAIEFINRHGSHHSDAIISEDVRNAEIFMDKVDSACVYHNASTRFTDGFQFGLGAEMGISTQKIHARGPVGIKELVCYKYKLYGNGEIRK